MICLWAVGEQNLVVGEINGKGGDDRSKQENFPFNFEVISYRKQFHIQNTVTITFA